MTKLSGIRTDLVLYPHQHDIKRLTNHEAVSEGFQGFPRITCITPGNWNVITFKMADKSRGCYGFESTASPKCAERAVRWSFPVSRYAPRVNVVQNNSHHQKVIKYFRKVCRKYIPPCFLFTYASHKPI